MTTVAMQNWGYLVRSLGVLRSSGPSLRNSVSVEFLFMRNKVRIEGIVVPDVQAPFILETPSFAAKRGDLIQVLTYVAWFDPTGLTKQLRRLRTWWPYTISNGAVNFTSDVTKVIFYLNDDLLDRIKRDFSFPRKPIQIFKSLYPRSSFTQRFVWAARSMRLMSRTRAFVTRNSLTRKGLPHSKPGFSNISSTFPAVTAYQIGNVQIYYTNSNVVVPKVLYRDRVRTLTPNFFSLRKSDRPINPYTMYEEQAKPRLGYQQVLTTIGGDTAENFWIGPLERFVTLPAVDWGSTSNAESQAFKRLIDAMGNEPFGLAQDLVQYRQTTDLIASNLTRIARAYRAVRKGDISLATRELFDNRPPRFRKGAKIKPLYVEDAIASNWLELQYGWKPLLSDIDTLIKKLHVEFRDYLRIARSSATVNSDSKTPITGPFDISISGVTPYTCGYINRSVKVKVKYGIRYRITSKDRQFLAQAGITNPINLAWEVLPYSFVVDWVYPIGPYLERLTAFEGMNFVDGYKSMFYEETIDAVASDSRTTAGATINIAFGTARKITAFVRTKLTTFPRQPSVQLKSPVSVDHALNALALLQTAFGGKQGVSNRFRT